jgi:2,3-dihydroxybenzoate-AMP ligase
VFFDALNAGRRWGKVAGLAMNIVEPIFAQCRNKPSELALCAPSTEFNLISYARLERSVNNICRRIIAAGIAPRSRVGVVIDDPIFHTMIVIALTRLGMITISASDRSTEWPITLNAVVTDRSTHSTAGNTVVADAGWTEGDDRPLAEKHLHRATSNELCRIVLIGDGRPKAIAMTHGMIATRIDRQKLFFGPRAPFCDRTHLDLPLAMSLGFHVMLGTLWRGGALLMTWDARKTLAAIAAYKIQNMIAAPQNLLKLTEAFRSQPGYRSNLEAVFAAGRLNIELSERIRACLCSNLNVGYIANDTTMVASMPAELASAVPGAAGYILPGVTVEVIGDDERAVPPGQDGNLRIRSDYGVKEYLDDPSATGRDFRNGWFYPAARGHVTGDKVLALSTGTEARFAMPTPWTASVRLQ